MLQTEDGTPPSNRFASNAVANARSSVSDPPLTMLSPTTNTRRAPGAIGKSAVSGERMPAEFTVMVLPNRL
jgi:hypothetical protein